MLTSSSAHRFIFLAGKIVRCLEFDRSMVELAVRLTSNRLNLSKETVQAQYEFQAAKAETQPRVPRARSSLFMETGKSLRKIAALVNLSGFRVHQILSCHRKKDEFNAKNTTMRLFSW